MPFASDIRQFITPAALAIYLGTLGVPDWPGDNPIGSTIHNTFRPLPSQWLGRPTMFGMQQTYIQKGWTSGPHFYLCIGAPNPTNDGIWQMTSPVQPGTHAGACNPRRFGIELVGDFQVKAPSLPQQRLLLDVLTVLHGWASLDADLVGHRDCMADRTCPGDHLYVLLPNLRTQLAARLTQAGAYRARHTQAIFESPTPDGRVALNDQAEVHVGETVILDEIKNGWGHLANDIGFVPIGILEKL